MIANIVPMLIFLKSVRCVDYQHEGTCENFGKEEGHNDIVDNNDAGGAAINVEGLIGEKVCEEFVDQVGCGENVSADVSDLSITLYELVKNNPVDKVVHDEDVNVSGKVLTKGKKDKTKSKGTNLSNCVKYHFKQAFDSVGKCVSKVHQYNVMRGDFPLNFEVDMTFSNFVEMMLGLRSLLGEDHMDKVYVFHFNC